MKTVDFESVITNYVMMGDLISKTDDNEYKIGIDQTRLEILDMAEDLDKKRLANWLASTGKELNHIVADDISSIMNYLWGDYDVK